MVSDFPGPLGWRGGRTVAQYRQTVAALRALDMWAADNGLIDPAARAVWLTIAAHDLDGAPLTMNGLLRSTGTSRYATAKVVDGAAARRLLWVGRSRRDGRQKTVELTPEGRRFLETALDRLPDVFQDRNE
jgi:DNA-binding MarR family transcriptional regulator